MADEADHGQHSAVSISKEKGDPTIKDSLIVVNDTEIADVFSFRNQI